MFLAQYKDNFNDYTLSLMIEVGSQQLAWHYLSRSQLLVSCQALNPTSYVSLN